MQPVAKPHPPGVTQPEEGCVVRVLQVSAVGGWAQWTMDVERVLARIGFNFDFAGEAVKSLVSCLRTFAVERMRSHHRRCVAHFPDVGSGPKSRHAKFASFRAHEGNVERYFVERVRISAGGRERQLDHDVGFRPQALLFGCDGERHSCPKQQGKEQLIR